MLLALAVALAGWAPGLAAASLKEQNRALADSLFTNHTLLQIALEVSEEGLESLRKAPREYVRAALRCGGLELTNIAVHLKGGSGSFRKVDDRPGLTLDFNRHDPDCRFYGLKKLHLNNCAQDPTRLSEFIGSELFREAGVPAARAAHALVELNGRQLGLYVVMEAMDSYFLSRYFKNNDGNLYGQTRGCDITNAIERMEGDAPLTYEDLKALSAAVFEEDPRRRLELLEKNLDVERFLSFMAMEVILVHHDGYTYNRHNYRIYQDLDTGRMVFFPHDLDQLMRRVSPSLLPEGRGLVGQAIMRTPELRARYQERVVFLATNLFQPARLVRRVDDAVAALYPGLARYDAEIAAAFTNTAAEFKTRILNRGQTLQRQLDILSGRLAPLAFVKDTARLTGWRPDGFPTHARMDRGRTEDRQMALHIRLEGANPPLVGAWRTLALLEPGWYRFEGLVRCAGVDSARRRRGEGAGLLVPLSRRFEPFRLTGDLTWQTVGVNFEVTAKADVELVCELRADKGEAWFAEDSLKLIRLAQGPTVSGAPTDLAAKAMETVKAAAPEAAKDVTRPIFHFRPPAGRMGEICGAFYHQGRYHLFFQFNPWSSTEEKGSGWGHARSRDLVRWEFLPPALLPDAQNGSILDGPGSAAWDGYGKPLLFYAHTPADFPKTKRQQWAALPEDETLLRWRRINLGLAPGKSGLSSGLAADWGDMFVFAAGGRTLAAFAGAKGLLCEAQNAGLTQWKPVGKLAEVEGRHPVLFALENRHVLMQTLPPVSFQVGDFDTNKLAFRSADKQPQYLEQLPPPKKGFANDTGLGGAYVFKDAKGRPILMGWINGLKPQGPWQGVLSLPRLLRLQDGQLRQEPVPELTLLRGRRVFLKPGMLNSTNRVLEGLRGDALEAVLEIKPGSAAAFGVRLRGAAASPADPVLRYASGRLAVNGREWPFALAAGEVFKLRLFFDRSLLEAFVGEGKLAIAQVVYPAAADLRLEVFSEGGDIQVQRLDGYALRPAW
mgnify:CR=1 FL=1